MLVARRGGRECPLGAGDPLAKEGPKALNVPARSDTARAAEADDALQRTVEVLRLDARPRAQGCPLRG